MSLIFHQTPDGVVIVVGVGATYVDTRTNFATDNGITAPAIPAPSIDRIYEPDIRHAISDGQSVVAAGPMPWSFGDTAIANVATLLAAQAKRLALPPKPMQQSAVTGKSSGTATAAS